MTEKLLKLTEKLTSVSDTRQRMTLLCVLCQITSRYDADITKNKLRRRNIIFCGGRSSISLKAIVEAILRDQEILDCLLSQFLKSHGGTQQHASYGKQLLGAGISLKRE